MEGREKPKRQTIPDWQVAHWPARILKCIERAWGLAVCTIQMSQHRVTVLMLCPRGNLGSGEGKQNAHSKDRGEGEELQLSGPAPWGQLVVMSSRCFSQQNERKWMFISIVISDFFKVSFCLNEGFYKEIQQGNFRASKFISKLECTQSKLTC